MNKVKNSFVSQPVLRFAVLATDVILLTLRDKDLLVRLVRVNRPPYFPDSKGLPGGLIDPKETAEEAVMRHLETKAGVDAKKIYMEQLYTFSALNRDPRGRVVAVAYLALVPWNDLSEKEKADGKDSWWAKIADATKLAYDHDKILTVAINRLRSRMRYTTVLSKIMPKSFTLSDLQESYENILKTKLDKRNFRKKIQAIKILAELPQKRSGLAYRPAALYKFKSTDVREIEIL